MQQDLDIALRFSEELQEEELGLIESVMNDINRNETEERRINWRNVEFKIKLRVVFHYNDRHRRRSYKLSAP